MTKRLARVAAVGVAAVAVAGPLTAAPAGAAPPASWAGSAAADGVRVAVVINEFLVVSDIVDAGGPAAQAAVSAFYGSQGLAAYPYPGDIVLTAHGLSQGAAPDYPLIAQSNNANQPSSQVSQGPYQLAASSTDDESKALAQAAADGGAAAAATTRSTAHVVHDPSTGTVTATAESTLEGFSVAGVLSIGRVHSAASMSSSGATPASDTEFGDVTVGGQQVGITDKGLVLAGTDEPLPPDSTANALLSGAGVTVHYLAPVRTPTSVVAPGLSVSAVQNVPGVGETTVTYLLGQASVSAQATGAGSAGTAGTAGAVGSPGVAGFPPSLRQSAAGGAGPASGAAVAPLPAAGGISSTGAAPVTAPAPTTAAPPGYRLAGATGPSSESLYLVLAVGAVVMAAAAQLFRVLAVRLAWT